MVSSYRIVILKSALKDKEKIKEIPALKNNVDKLIEVLKTDPFKNPPPYEKLSGNYKELYSRRINRQHRLVYKVKKEDRVVTIISMWSHYEF
ncbi:Txe/YoeB family addiction module toxin [Acetobacterium wieringae]|uniref:Txe/YoeB family addiction module toxin n=1 Tax=Acetobacterium wieringae TaxID=52694 RepID=UPI002B1FE95C|nr:Txe/YoeB family addiction module toxin [Acetobacterium wieringae]MEA4805059.1 Txe/YoeB family addiction module toxin [Acetobacterium wieringae]